MDQNLHPLALEIIRLIQANQLSGKDDLILKAIAVDEAVANTIFNIGLSCAQSKRLQDALLIFTCLKVKAADDPRVFYNLGLIYSLLGNHEQAIDSYDLALAINPNDVDALINKGSSCNRNKNYVLALNVLNQATSLNSDIPQAWSNKGIALNNLKRYEESVESYGKALSLNPNFVEAWSNKSVPLNKLKRVTEALEACEQAINLRPSYAEAFSNKADILCELKQYVEALECYDQAIALKPDFVEAFLNKGNALCALRRYEEALKHYDQAIFLSPEFAEAWHNKGIALYRLGLKHEALTPYERAIRFKPNYHEAWTNKGVALSDLKLYRQALTHFDKAIELQPDYAEAWSNKGAALCELGFYEEAITNYEESLRLKGDGDYIDGECLHAKMKICAWENIQGEINTLVGKVGRGQKVIQPFQALSIADDIVLHQQCSSIYAQDNYPPNNSLGPIALRSRAKKIRIGYFSPDFRNHPVALLTSEMFKLHDHNLFELYAFSLEKASDNEVGHRLKQSFNYFIDVEHRSDLEVAQIAREFKIDIAVDLAGHTKNSRTGIFALRAAPIQVNWLGFPGTLGANFIDYIVADPILIPVNERQFFAEKVVYLPHTYMVDDSLRVPSDRKFSRQDFGLPENSFVFCCFNNDYKFNLAVIDSWARILHQVKHGVLWVSENNLRFGINLRQEFVSRGIKGSRIFFAKKVQLMGDHLARYALADLFLDTHPYNAHTTAMDSLKAGIPLITLMGNSFASRVAASLLNAIGLPELITQTSAEYEALAIELATNPQKLAAIKQKLSDQRLSAPLFDTPLFTKNLEAAYIKMVERYQADLPPDHLVIE